MNMRALTGTNDLPRRTFTVKEVERMGELGLLLEDERVELIGGELILMNARGSRHEALKYEINRRWGALDDPEIGFIPETTFRLSPDTFLEPDFLLFPSSVGIRGLNQHMALLAVELSDSSLGFDLGAKALVYAHFGIRELWVIDARAIKVHVHREPVDGRYRSVRAFDADALVLPAFVAAAFGLRLTDLDLDFGPDDEG